MNKEDILNKFNAIKKLEDELKTLDNKYKNEINDFYKEDLKEVIEKSDEYIKIYSSFEHDSSKLQNDKFVKSLALYLERALNIKKGDFNLIKYNSDYGVEQLFIGNSDFWGMNCVRKGRLGSYRLFRWIFTNKSFCDALKNLLTEDSDKQLIENLKVLSDLNKDANNKTITSNLLVNKTIKLFKFQETFNNENDTEINEHNIDEIIIKDNRIIISYGGNYNMVFDLPRIESLFDIGRSKLISSEITYLSEFKKEILTLLNDAINKSKNSNTEFKDKMDFVINKLSPYLTLMEI